MEVKRAFFTFLLLSCRAARRHVENRPRYGGSQLLRSPIPCRSLAVTWPRDHGRPAGTNRCRGAESWYTLPETAVAISNHGTPLIDLRLFGFLDLRGEEGEEILSVLAQPKRMALLTYLALAASEGFIRRDSLLGIFWSESDQERGRGALRKSLHHLRRSLGEEAIRNRGDEEVELNRDLIRCDAVDFHLALSRGDLEEALRLYQGDLLPGFFLPDCPAFERWLERERARLKELAAQAAWDMAHLRLASGAVNDAERSARKALDLIPTDESEVRRFSRALVGAGDRGGALHLLEILLSSLREEYGVEPSSETLLAMEEIKTLEGPPGDGSGPHPSVMDTGGGRAPSSVPVLEDRRPLPISRAEASDVPSGRRHMVEWGATFVATAWALIALMGFLERQFQLPETTMQIFTIVVVFGCFMAMILTWYHRERGIRRVTGPELIMITLLLCILAIALSMVGSGSSSASPSSTQPGFGAPFQS